MDILWGNLGSSSFPAIDLMQLIFVSEHGDFASATLVVDVSTQSARRQPKAAVCKALTGFAPFGLTHKVRGAADPFRSARRGVFGWGIVKLAGMPLA